MLSSDSQLYNESYLRHIMDLPTGSPGPCTPIAFILSRISYRNDLAPLLGRMIVRRCLGAGRAQDVREKVIAGLATGASYYLDIGVGV